MSRWWPEPLRLLLAPGPADGLATATSSGRGETALAAWRLALTEAAPQRGRRVACTVRDDLLRYRVVPWRPLLTDPKARQAWARQCFIEAYGEAARPWFVQVDRPRFGRASLACAIEPGLLAGVQAELTARGLRSAGVWPQLMLAFNQHRQALPAAGGWFVLLHDAGLSLLLLRDGEVQHVKQMAGLVQTLSQTLKQTLERESFALGLEPGPTAPVVADMRQLAARLATQPASQPASPEAGSGVSPRAAAGSLAPRHAQVQTA